MGERGPSAVAGETFERLAIAKLAVDAMQLPLFDAGERRGIAVDRVRNRFGYHAVHPGDHARPAAAMISRIPTADTHVDRRGTRR